MNDPCGNCTIRQMAQEGCCTTPVRGSKFLKNRTTGARMEVCADLTRMDDGSWGCSSQPTGEKPSDCYAFGCEKQINSRG